MHAYFLHSLMFFGCGGHVPTRTADSGDPEEEAEGPTSWDEKLVDDLIDADWFDEDEERVDLDDDGWTVDLDCNDQDARIHPGAPEFCDGIDTDCDGVVDPNNAVDAEVWFRDLDGDGYGNPYDTVLSCSHPGDPFVAQGGDCDDTMDMVHPGAMEIWDGIDNDCDGQVDSGPLDGKWAGL